MLPNTPSVEEVFHAANAQSALKLARSRRRPARLGRSRDFTVGEHSALEVKKSVVGHGHAAKEQVQFMMKSLLGEATPVHLPDACDALAVAVCEATRARFESLRTNKAAVRA